jgi:hypothetical protein
LLILERNKQKANMKLSGVGNYLDSSSESEGEMNAWVSPRVGAPRAIGSSGRILAAQLHARRHSEQEGRFFCAELERCFASLSPSECDRLMSLPPEDLYRLTMGEGGLLQGWHAYNERRALRSENNGFGVDYIASPPSAPPVASLPANDSSDEEEFEGCEVYKSAEKTLARSRASSEKAKTFRAAMATYQDSSDSDPDALYVRTYKTTGVGGGDDLSAVTQADRKEAAVEEAVPPVMQRP